MNFFKQAQEFVGSANTTTNDGGNTGTAPAASEGGFGSFIGEAQNMLKSQGGAPGADGSAAPPAEGSLPGGRTAPTNQELMKSGQLLFGAAQGQNVDQAQLAGAASDILGGLEAHGNLDQGTYGKYVNQAEDYLDKYAAKGQPGAAAGAGGAAPPPTDAPVKAPVNASDAAAPPTSTGSADEFAPGQ